MSEIKGTKHTLAQALKTLMSSQPFEKISVSDICAHCGVSRKSFYYHFQDKYDLMNWIFYTEFVGTLQLPHQTDGFQLLLNICTYFFKEQVFYRNALSVHGQNCFQDYFVEIIEPFVFAFVQELYSGDDDISFYVTFYTDAFLSSIVRWLNEGAVIPPERYAHLLRNAVLNSSPANG